MVMFEAVLLVDGMGCNGCVTSLTQRLVQVPGVSTVTVELVSGATSTVRVSGPAPLVLEDLEAAVLAAGKRLAPPLRG
jgi:copper chaperone CopZ